MTTKFTPIPTTPDVLKRMQDFTPVPGAPSYTDLLVALHQAVGDEKDHDIPGMLGYPEGHSVPQHVVAVKHAISAAGSYL